MIQVLKSVGIFFVLLDSRDTDANVLLIFNIGLSVLQTMMRPSIIFFST